MIDQDGGICQRVIVTGAGEDTLGGRLNVDINIRLLSHCGAIVIVVSNVSNVLRTAQFSTVNDSLSEGVLVVVIDRIVRRSTRASLASNVHVLRLVTRNKTGGGSDRTSGKAAVGSADRCNIEVISGRAGKTGNGSGMSCHIDSGARTTRKPFNSIFNGPATGSLQVGPVEDNAIASSERVNDMEVANRQAGHQRFNDNISDIVVVCRAGGS